MVEAYGQTMEPIGSSSNMLSKASGKSKHKGAGGRGNKSHNAHEAFAAHKKRQAKAAREEQAEEE